MQSGFWLPGQRHRRLCLTTRGKATTLANVNFTFVAIGFSSIGKTGRASFSKCFARELTTNSASAHNLVPGTYHRIHRSGLSADTEKHRRRGAFSCPASPAFVPFRVCPAGKPKDFRVLQCPSKTVSVCSVVQKPQILLKHCVRAYGLGDTRGASAASPKSPLRFRRRPDRDLSQRLPGIRRESGQVVPKIRDKGEGGAREAPRLMQGAELWYTPHHGFCERVLECEEQ